MADDGAPAPRTELRLAVMMSGGVSLCVWMGGASLEIDRLRHGEGIYGALAELTDVEPVVDIVAGTSAGGLNGVLLAAATAWESDLNGLRDTWLGVADFGSLLREPTGTAPRSMLRGEDYFVPKVAEALKAIRKNGPTSNGGRARPRIHAVVTTTLTEAVNHRHVDDSGAVHDRPTQLGLFHFRQDATPVTPGSVQDAAQRLAAGEIVLDPPLVDFGLPWEPEPVAVDRLARAARSSASFPFAFEPSFVDVDLKGGDRVAGGAANLAWIADFDVSRFTMDGGLLDNVPLDLVLNLISTQPEVGPVRRAVLFVEPLAGPQPADRPHDREGDEPSLLDVTKTTLLAPASDRVSTVLENLDARTHRTTSLRDVRLRLFGTDEPSEPFRPVATLIPIAEIMSEAAHRLSDVLDAARQDAGRRHGAKEGQAPQRHTILISHIRQNLLTTQDLLRRAQRILGEVDDLATARATVSDALVETERSVRFVQLAAAKTADGGSKGGQPDVAATRALMASDDVAAMVGGLLERARVASAAGMTALVALARVDDTADPPTVSAGQVEGVPTAVALHALRSEVAAVTALARVAAEAVGAAEVDAAAWWRALCDLDALQSIVTDGRTHNPQRIERYDVTATARCVLGRQRPPSEKLTGVQLMHFGAFYAPSWRQNDWIWGRLDGSLQLLDLMAEPTRLLGMSDAPTIATVIADALVPEVESKRHIAFVDELIAALHAVSDASEPAALLDARREFVDLVAAEVHAAILAEELPRLRRLAQSDLDAHSNDSHLYQACVAAIEDYERRPSDRAALVEAWNDCRLADARLTGMSGQAEIGSQRFAEVTTRAAGVTLDLLAGDRQPPLVGTTVSVLRWIVRFAHFLTTPAASSGPLVLVIGAVIYVTTLLGLAAATGRLSIVWAVPGLVTWVGVLVGAVLKRRMTIFAGALVLLAVTIGLGIAYHFHIDVWLIIGGAIAAGAASVAATFASATAPQP